MRRQLLVGVMGGLVLSGCAGISPTQVGQTAGTIAGAVLVPGIGAPLGALTGLLAGMVVQGEVDKVTEKRERKELGAELSGGSPSAPAGESPTQGEPTRVWVDETVQGGRLVAGHFDVRSL